MSTVTVSPGTTSPGSTVSPGTTAGRAASRLTRTLPRATATAGVLAAAATTAGAALLRAAGIPLAAHGTIPLAGFAQLTLIAAVAGGVLMAVLTRRSPAPRRRFLQITAALTAISCAAPAAVGDTTASKITLAGLHLIAAAIIIPMLARTTR